MSFSITKPDAGPSPKVDVDQLRDNFGTFAPAFAENHTALNNRNQGCHEAVLFEQQAIDPIIGGTYATLYAKSVTNTLGTEPQIFARLPVFLPTEDDTRGAGNDPMQMTYSKVNTAGPQYQSFWPGGYVVYTGQTTDITIPITLVPAPSSIVIAIAAAHNMTVSFGTPVPYNAATNILSASSFKIDSNLNFTGPVQPYLFTWIAVGIQ
jgi:hypothetical protein